MDACLSEIGAHVKATWNARIRFDFRVRSDLPVVARNRLNLQSLMDFHEMRLAQSGTRLKFKFTEPSPRGYVLNETLILDFFSGRSSR